MADRKLYKKKKELAVRKVSLKMVIDREKEKVVFAEASSDFADILFSFLTFPMGTIVRLLANRSDPSHPPENIGGYTNLYGSVANLDAMYFGTNGCKDMLLNTRNSAEAQCRHLRINIDDMQPIQYFICEDYISEHALHRNSAHMISTSSHVKCKFCGCFLDRALDFESSTIKGDKSVFVTKTSSFVISDDLHVIPNNPASTLGILESYGIKDFAVLEEKTWKLGSKEILDLLQCSFLSKTPLSDVFFGKKCINSPVPTIQSQTGTKSTKAKMMTVKVFVQKSNKKILLAQCSEDFIDFLFSLLTIPLGKLISLMARDHESPLTIENIHQGVLELNVHEYLKSRKMKNMLLNPKLSMQYLCSNHIFPLEEETGLWDTTPDGKYTINLDVSYMVGQEFTLQRRKGAGGFVGGPTKFMVTDDLVVTPLSSMACFTYLRKMKMNPSDIEEQVVNIGMDEALNLMRASLTSTEVLTNGLKFLIMKNPKSETSVYEAQSKRLLKKPKVEK